MANLNLQYYKGSDLYTDGDDIEEKMLALAVGDEPINDLSGQEFPIIYHFSEIRHNILSWYPFNKTGIALEIGAGCGALTGLLCERLSRVVSVELSHKRSSINYERNKKYSNLEIMVGNLQDMQMTEKFDYIIVNGVLEYAMSFTSGDTPYEDFLNSLCKYLKDDGRILIAIENRLGIKYFAGAPEDHTDNFFLGLEGYVGNDTVRTFSKTEIVHLLSSVGLDYYKFYYPYPDYKFPREIFSDDYLTEDKVGKDYYNIGSKRFFLYDETKVEKSLAKEGIVDRFMNSFLIEASKNQIIDRVEIKYVKFSDDRNPEYRIMTKIQEVDGIKKVLKQPLLQDAYKHVKNMFRYSGCKQGSGDIVCSSSEIENNSISFEYINTPSLATKIEDLIAMHNIAEAYEIIKNFYNKLIDMGERKTYGQDKFQQVFGTDVSGEDVCIEPANVDLILDNVFLTDDGYTVIDYEWMFDFPIPVKFIIWRGLNDLLEKYVGTHIFSEDQLFGMYNITKCEQEKYASWNCFFCEHYVGASRYSKLSSSKIHMSLDKEMREWEINHLIGTSLYIDLGNGYSEKNKIYIETDYNNGIAEVCFNLGEYKDWKSLRWDPVENELCYCEVMECTEGIEVIPINAIKVEDNTALFMTIDPMYEIINEKRNSEIYIKYRITKCDDETICMIMDEKNEKYENQKEETERVKTELENVYSSRGWKIIEKIRNMTGKH